MKERLIMDGYEYARELSNPGSTQKPSERPTNTLPPTNVDLSLISFEDMYAELCKRYDHCVFAGIVHQSQPKYVVTKKYKGYRYVCMGLLSNLETMINKDENESLGPAIEP